MNINVDVIAFSKLRFGDPITSIGIGKNSVIHGSIMGRLVYYSIEKKEEREFVDMTSEMVRAITLSADGSKYYIVNGDIGWRTLPENNPTELTSYSVAIKGPHNDLCERSFVFQAKGYNCLVILSAEDEMTSSKGLITDIDYNPYQAEDKFVLTNMETHVINRIKKTDKELLSFDSIPCDFDGQRVM